MADEKFWDNREKAQGFIDEAGVIRNKLEPLLKFEKQLDDFNVMSNSPGRNRQHRRHRSRRRSRANSCRSSRSSMRSN